MVNNEGGVLVGPYLITSHERILADDLTCGWLVDRFAQELPPSSLLSRGAAGPHTWNAVAQGHPT